MGCMENFGSITRDELRTSIDERRSWVLLDVLLPESFGEAHLPGAKNACVYEVTFLDDVAKLAPDKSTPVVLYGSSSRNLASATAAEKLIRAGYKDVRDYRGGVEDWEAAGWELERGVHGPTSVVQRVRTRNGAYE
jgi:rhodanese-related sulfurtransferase